MRIERLGAEHAGRVERAAALFDATPAPEWTARFLAAENHHLLMAFSEDGDATGFVSGVETVHPDKGVEMFLYELGVAPEHRGRGIGTALVAALGDLARGRGCHGMWVATEPDNEAALATYRAAGASDPEPAVVLEWSFR
ncbi:MAG TPA: GNAT family N-acetyltransferase [Actinomycetota bacterium]|nr:GNAT family N-acetyltransferase [Actinomycetota bacterium]